MVPVYENYKDYPAPRYARAAIENILAKLPQQYLSGLRSVVLTNATAVGEGKTHRIKGKKYLRRECLGYYHPKTTDGQAWIEIVVDNVIAGWPTSGIARVLWRFPLIRNARFAQTLCHEVGHHLDHILGAPAPSGEAAAEAWKKRLLRLYGRRQYWYLVPFMRLCAGLLETILRVAARRREAARSR
ncbi:MAG: hypothetical protein ABSH46_12100 [Bryobacteraceae bacterium]|jgi:hypothetical protein